MATQDDVFLSGEGDRYFQRNRDGLTAARANTDAVLRGLEIYDVRATAVLELGCANGWRVAVVTERLGCRGAGVDAGAEAIAVGEATYPSLDLRCSGLDALPFDDLEFDLVLVPWVLCWLDRQQVLPALSEIDRVLVAGGTLVFCDFLPREPTRRRYHHRDDVEIWTYKQDYATILGTLPWYRQVATMTGRAGGGGTFDLAPDDGARFSLTILRKLRVEDSFSEDSP